MPWLERMPKKPSSIEAALLEVRRAIVSFKARRHEVLDNEVSLEYPREGRLEKYKEQLLCLDRVLTSLDKTIAELRCYQ